VVVTLQPGRAVARWRLLSPLAQAVLVIAFLRTNLTCAELAEGFGISPVTCWRNIREGISVLAGKGRRISLADVAQLAVRMGWDYLIVDGVHGDRCLKFPCRARVLTVLRLRFRQRVSSYGNQCR
jgi:hypothetical protein